MKIWILTLCAIPILLGLTSCQASPASVRDISQAEFVSDALPDMVLLDVRTPDEYAKSHVPGAILIPFDQLAERVDELGAKKDRPVVVYCESGKRAGYAGETLLEAGFTDVLHLDGDMRAWRESGRPTE